MNTVIPAALRDMVVEDAGQVERALGRCSVLFSAIALEKERVRALEFSYAHAGFAVVSNNSAHRGTPEVPMIIPEVNPEHLDIITSQRRLHGWDKGLVAVKSNCSIQSYMTPLFALIQAGYRPSRMFVTTLQALSGAGYPGPSALDIIDNVVPFIKGEEEKSETEPLKILGRVEGDQIVSDATLAISAQCNRVPVLDGHIACVNLEFAGTKPKLGDIVQVWRDFRGVPQALGLPSAPEQPIIYREEPDRPQPRRDRDADKAMAITVGRLRPCNICDIRFIGLHHNTVRGAAGGAILTAELLKKKGFIV
jgi:aspartate-semialdehyde dehydrogenase